MIHLAAVMLAALLLMPGGGDTDKTITGGDTAKSGGASSSDYADAPLLPYFSSLPSVPSSLLPSPPYDAPEIVVPSISLAPQQHSDGYAARFSSMTSAVTQIRGPVDTAASGLGAFLGSGGIFGDFSGADPSTTMSVSGGGVRSMHETANELGSNVGRAFAFARAVTTLNEYEIGSTGPFIVGAFVLILWFVFVNVIVAVIQIADAVWSVLTQILDTIGNWIPFT